VIVRHFEKKVYSLLTLSPSPSLSPGIRVLPTGGRGREKEGRRREVREEGEGEGRT
jgi:hypothetical protein